MQTNELKNEEKEPNFRYYRTKDGRVFISFGKGRKEKCLSIETVGTKSRKLSFGIHASDDYEQTFGFNLCVPFLFSLYVNLDMSPPEFLQRFCGKYRTREYEFYANGDGICFHFHTDPMDSGGSYSGRWEGFSRYYSWEKIFKGKSRVETNVVYSTVLPIVIPARGEYEEKEYMAKVTKTDYKTIYSRWKTFKWHRWEVEVEEGVPHPGKGTTSYNCEEDCLYSCSFPFGKVNNVEEAIKEFIESCNYYREKYPL